MSAAEADVAADSSTTLEITPVGTTLIRGPEESRDWEGLVELLL
jgi:hypothetical protein